MQQRQQQKSQQPQYLGASRSMSKDKSMDASNSKADNRRNTFNSMDASNIMHQGKNMDATNRTNRGNICIKLLKLESSTREQWRIGRALGW